MRKSVFVGLLIGLALTWLQYGARPALAQAAVDTPTAGTATVAGPTVPGVGINLNLVQQLLDSAGQLDQSALSAGNANLNANIGRLDPSVSSLDGGAGSTSSGASSR